MGHKKTQSQIAEELYNGSCEGTSGCPSWDAYKNDTANKAEVEDFNAQAQVIFDEQEED